MTNNNLFCYTPYYHIQFHTAFNVYNGGSKPGHCELSPNMPQGFQYKINHVKLNA